jgi:hypothetical protein
MVKLLREYSKRMKVNWTTERFPIHTPTPWAGRRERSKITKAKHRFQPNEAVDRPMSGLKSLVVNYT